MKSNIYKVSHSTVVRILRSRANILHEWNLSFSNLFEELDLEERLLDLPRSEYITNFNSVCICSATFANDLRALLTLMNEQIRLRYARIAAYKLFLINNRLRKQY